MMQSKITPSLICFAAILTITPSVKAEVTAEQVKRAVDSGVGFLKKNQREDGSWSQHSGYPGGVTSLCTLALLNAGVPADAREIQKALRYLRRLGEPAMVYSTALQTMVFCEATPEKDRLLIQRNVEWLEKVQITSGPRRGAWKYSDRRGSGDNSNSQFALLALHEAQRIGVEVQPRTWALTLQHWLSKQNPDGSWSYVEGQPATGSMTCAGIASVVIALEKIQEDGSAITGGRVECCGARTDNDAVERGLQWLGSHFSASRNPNPVLEKAWLYYYLYGVERVGRLTGRRFLGRHDWYREGAQFLVSQQDDLSGYWRGEYLAEENALIATSFSLLFLSKGRRPVVVSQLQYGTDGDWERHRNGVHQLTRRIEKSWKQRLTWQTIDIRAASLEDLLETPVLFISGRDHLTLSPDEKESLSQYVNQGGFIFAEACCEGTGFDRDFRALVQELFPDSSLRVLGPDHPVWFAEQRVDPDHLRTLMGVEACCRTSIVYCPPTNSDRSVQGDLSCFWQLARSGKASSEPISQEVEACLRIGQNVVAYATNRELKDKLDRPQIAGAVPTGLPERNVLVIPKLMHSGGGDDAPNALPNMLRFLSEKSQLRVLVDNRKLTASEAGIVEYPILFLHGRRAFRFTPAERRQLATYLERGGVLIADAICGNEAFAQSFRHEVQAITNASLQRISPNHPLFSREFHGYDLSQVTLRDPQTRSETDPLRANLKPIKPLLEGLEVDGRFRVFFSPYDISCALESGRSVDCKGYVKRDAARLALNLILFALQQ